MLKSLAELCRAGGLKTFTFKYKSDYVEGAVWEVSDEDMLDPLLQITYDRPRAGSAGAGDPVEENCLLLLSPHDAAAIGCALLAWADERGGKLCPPTTASPRDQWIEGNLPLELPESARVCERPDRLAEAAAIVADLRQIDALERVCWQDWQNGTLARITPKPRPVWVFIAPIAALLILAASGVASSPRHVCAGACRVR